MEMLSGLPGIGPALCSTDTNGGVAFSATWQQHQQCYRPSASTVAINVADSIQCQSAQQLGDRTDLCVYCVCNEGGKSRVFVLSHVVKR